MFVVLRDCRLLIACVPAHVDVSTAHESDIVSITQTTLFFDLLTCVNGLNIGINLSAEVTDFRRVGVLPHLLISVH